MVQSKYDNQDSIIRVRPIKKIASEVAPAEDFKAHGRTSGPDRLCAKSVMELTDYLRGLSIQRESEATTQAPLSGAYKSAGSPVASLVALARIIESVTSGIYDNHLAAPIESG